MDKASEMAAKDRKGAARRPVSEKPHRCGGGAAPRGFAGDQRGQTLIEFAVVSVMLFTCVFGIMDGSRALYAYHFTSYAAREATRYAVVRGSTYSSTPCATTSTLACDATAANIASFVQSIVPPGISAGSALTVAASWPGTAPTGAVGVCSIADGVNSPGCSVKVQVSYLFNYIAPFMPGSGLLMTSTAESVIQQ